MNEEIIAEMNARHGDQDELRQLRERANLLEAAMENFPCGILVFDGENRLVFCNEQQKKLLEYPDELSPNRRPSLNQMVRYNAERGEYGPGDVKELAESKMALIEERVAHIFERTRPNGTILEVRGVPLSGGGFVSTYIDVTEQRKSQEMNKYLAYHDKLTGLPNRTLLLDRLKVVSAGAKRGHHFALHYIDLDNFKKINDVYGHSAGDTVLKKSAAVLQSVIRETDTIARLGGDEIVVIQTDIESTNNANALANRLHRALSGTCFFEDVDLKVNCSIGVSFGPLDGESAEELLRKADAAMYRSKRLGSGYTSFYNPTYHTEEIVLIEPRDQFQIPPCSKDQRNPWDSAS